MSQKPIKLYRILKEILTEVGDLKNIVPFEHDLSRGTFTVVYKNIEYRGKVTFLQLNEKGLEPVKLPPVVDIRRFSTGFNIGYSVEGITSQFLKGDLKLLLTILKTVSLIVGDFIGRHPDPLFLIFAESKTGTGYEDSQKLLIYGEVLGKNIPQGFRIGEMEIAHVTRGLFICKK